MNKPAPKQVMPAPGRSAMTMDDMLEAGERIIWQDRAPGPGSRAYSPPLQRSLKDHWLPISFVTAATIGSVVIAFTGPPEGVWRTLMLPVALLGFLLLLIGYRRQEERYFQKAELHYVLTDKRLILHDATEGWTLQVFPGGLGGLRRRGRNIDVFMKHPKDAHTLVALADPDAAERAIAKTLGPIE